MPKIKVKGQTVQTGERPQTNGRAHTHTHTDGRYQTYYLPCYAVDKDLIFLRDIRGQFGVVRVCVCVCVQSMDSALESWDSNGLDGVTGKGVDKSSSSQGRRPFDGQFRIQPLIIIIIMSLLLFQTNRT